MPATLSSGGANAPIVNQKRRIYPPGKVKIHARDFAFVPAHDTGDLY
jgi:hypothetical protein